jgi:hypothetical protein
MIATQQKLLQIHIMETQISSNPEAMARYICAYAALRLIVHPDQNITTSNTASHELPLHV